MSRSPAALSRFVATARDPPGPTRVDPSNVRSVSTAAHSAKVIVSGHLMDTGILARVLDDVLEYGGDYRIESLDLGRQHEDESKAVVEISADEADRLDRILMRVQIHGANAVDPGVATTRPAPSDG